jgi:hypothetical protein
MAFGIRREGTVSSENMMRSGCKTTPSRNAKPSPKALIASMLIFDGMSDKDADARLGAPCREASAVASIAVASYPAASFASNASDASMVSGVMSSGAPWRRTSQIGSL